VADEWTRAAQEGPDDRTIRYGDKIGGAKIKYGDGYKYGDTTSIWTRATQTTATVSEE
jgi:hypothetical protein